MTVVTTDPRSGLLPRRGSDHHICDIMIEPRHKTKSRRSQWPSTPLERLENGVMETCCKFIHLVLSRPPSRLRSLILKNSGLNFGVLGVVGFRVASKGWTLRLSNRSSVCSDCSRGKSDYSTNHFVVRVHTLITIFAFRFVRNELAWQLLPSCQLLS